MLFSILIQRLNQCLALNEETQGGRREGRKGEKKKRREEKRKERKSNSFAQSG